MINTKKMKIELHNMRFYAQHGCYETEQKVGTRFEVNLTVEYDGTTPQQSDHIEEALNYLDLYNLVAREMAIPSHLLERVAYRILEAVGNEFPQALWAGIEVSKIAPPLGGDIERVTVCSDVFYDVLK